MPTCLVCDDTFNDPASGWTCACGAQVTFRTIADEEVDLTLARAWWRAGGWMCVECDEPFTPAPGALTEADRDRARCPSCTDAAAEMDRETWGLIGLMVAAFGGFLHLAARL